MTLRRNYPWLQGLRAAAALAIAFYHTADDAIAAGGDPSGAIARVVHWMPWTAGVDLFFVISGFVIIHASEALFATPTGSRRFLCRRLWRIVPLYWTLTTLFLGVILLQHSAVHAQIGDGGYILASYFFLPWRRPDGIIEPALGLGWTLNYEMFFYLMLTPFLVLSRVFAVAGGVAVLCLLVIAGRWFSFRTGALQFWVDPIVLEFALGMAIALAFSSLRPPAQPLPFGSDDSGQSASVRALSAGFALPHWLRFALIAVSIAWLRDQASVDASWRIGAFGIPSALLVIAAISGRRNPRQSLAIRVLVGLGDASYALYLFHPFVMRACTLFASRWHPHTETAGIAYVALSLIMAEICAVLIHTRFERPIGQMVSRRGLCGPALVG